MTILLIVLGLLPFALGGLTNWLMVANSYMLPPALLLVISLIALLFWAVLAYVTKKYIRDTKKVMLCLHVVPLIMLLLLGIQELLLHQYWTNFFGMLTQLYYLPLLRLGTILIGWLSASLFPIYCVAFLLMAVAAFAGCKLQRK